MSDVVEIHTALLRRFAELIKKLTPEELADIAAGTLKIGILDRPGGRSSSTTPTVDHEAIARKIGSMQSRLDAATYIDKQKLTLAGLKSLAKALDVALSGATTKAQVRDRIVEHVLGYRLNSQTIREGNWSSR